VKHLPKISFQLLSIARAILLDVSQNTKNLNYIVTYTHIQKVLNDKFYP